MGRICETCGQPWGGLEEVMSVDTIGTTPTWRASLGDCVAIMRTLPAESVDAVITDPPYGSGGFTLKDRMRTSKEKYVSGGAKYATALPDIEGDSVHPAAWEAVIRDFLKESVRVLRPGSSVLVFIDWRNDATMTELLFASGLRPQGKICWDKGRASRPRRGGFRQQSEFIHWATKGSLKPAGDIYLDGVLHYRSIVNNKRHITEKPLELMSELMRVCAPNGAVLDPFMGSGTTGVAAVASGRRFVGCELVPQYFDTAVERLRDARE